MAKKRLNVMWLIPKTGIAAKGAAAPEPPPPPEDPPLNTSPPNIDSASIVDVMNTASPGSWLYMTSLAYQWEVSDTGLGAWSDIPGATDPDWTPTPRQYGKFFRVKETATGPGGSSFIYSNITLATTVDPMTFQVTTTGASQTLTINGLTVTASTNVDWGDGLNNNYTGGASRSHVYAAAGTYTVTIDKPWQVTHFDIRDAKVSQLLGTELWKFVNGLNLRILTVPDAAVSWIVGDTAPMIPNLQYLQLELYTGINWVVGGLDPMPNINDVLNLRGLPNVTWTIGPTNPIPILAESFTIRECPGVTYSRISITNPTWKVNDLHIVRIENGWTQQMVDDFLLDMYHTFPTRVNGATDTIDLLGGSPANAAPSGVLAAMCPPTTGKAAAYELVNDSCGVSPNHWVSVTTA